MGVSLANSEAHSKGQALAMFSYGIYKNTGSYDFDLAYSQDKFCSVFSEETRRLEDSEDFELPVWSIATGCDISVGD